MSLRALDHLRLIAAAALCVVLSLTLALPARAADEAQGISGAGLTVSGTAWGRGKPSVVEIGTTVSGDAELTADAVVKYRDAKKRAIAAIEGMKLPGLSVESSGYSISPAVDQNAQMAMMRGQVASSTKQK